MGARGYWQTEISKQIVDAWNFKRQVNGETALRKLGAENGGLGIEGLDKDRFRDLL